MSRKRVVVIGAGYAGRSAMMRLMAQGVDAEITVIDPRPALTERVRWHERAAGEARDTVALANWLPDGVKHVVSRAVEVGASSVTLERGDALPYDHVILATGSRTDDLGVPGVQEHARTLEQGALPHLASVNVVGGGSTGIEVATELAARGRLVRLIASELGAGLSPRALDHIRGALERLGVEVMEGARVEEVDAAGVRLEGGGRADADVTLWCAGVRPWEAPVKAAMDERGRLLVTPELRLRGHENVWVAGDLARVEHQDGHAMRATCALAMPMGTHVGDNLGRVLRGESATAFAYKPLLLCISLGPDDGVVQVLDANDAPTKRVVTGRTAAWIKERIVRATLWLPQVEGRRGWKMYGWLQAPVGV